MLMKCFLFLLQSEMMHASFHFPLHRYLAAFISQACKTMGIPLRDILPQAQQLKLLMMHLLRVQVSHTLIQIYILYQFCNTFNYIKSFNIL